jgi:hypothetical protein
MCWKKEHDMAGVKEKRENPMPVIDDGWWASVLAEESRSSAVQNRLVGNKHEVRKKRKAYLGAEDRRQLALRSKICIWR